MTALGMIEVRGYLGAVSVADAALKAANVTLNNAEVIRGGLTTIELVGDVSAVKAAVDAAVQIAEQLNCLLSSHVIARLDEQTMKLTKPIELKPTTEKAETEVNIEEKKQSSPNTHEVVSDLLATKASHEEMLDETVKNEEEIKEKLTKKKVVDLRKLAYQMNLKGLTKKEIKFATKNRLVTAILAELEGSEIEWS